MTEQDAARLAEIRANHNGEDAGCTDECPMVFLLRLLDAAIVERDEAEALALSNEEAGRQALAGGIRQIERAEAAEAACARALGEEPAAERAAISAARATLLPGDATPRSDPAEPDETR